MLSVLPLQTFNDPSSGNILGLPWQLRVYLHNFMQQSLRACVQGIPILAYIFSGLHDFLEPWYKLPCLHTTAILAFGVTAESHRKCSQVQNEIRHFPESYIYCCLGTLMDEFGQTLLLDCYGAGNIFLVFSVQPLSFVVDLHFCKLEFRMDYVLPSEFLSCYLMVDHEVLLNANNFLKHA